MSPYTPLEFPSDFSPEEVRLFTARDAALEFARTCRSVEENTPVDAETSLGELINALMTELWDNGFSAAEVRAAFEDAAKDVSRYAGADELNGSGIRGTAVR